MGRLSISEKREFYSGLARLIRSGSPLPSALDLLSRNTRRGLGDFLRAVNDRIKRGEPLGDALLMQQPGVSELEAGVVSAAGRSGRLDHGCDQLARYFDSLERARQQIISRSMYPLVMLHVTILMVNIVTLLQDGLRAYLLAILVPFAVVYSIAAVVWLVFSAMAAAARSNVVAERILRLIPGLGPIREKFAFARFFTTLDAQLEAQVNIWDAFANAARVSGSARMLAAARAIIPMLQGGERLSEALAAKRLFPDEYIRSFRVAEQAGELDAELSALAQRSEEAALRVLDRWAEWLPKIIYALVLVYAGFCIVSWYRVHVIDPIQKVDPFDLNQ